MRFPNLGSLGLPKKRIPTEDELTVKNDKVRKETKPPQESEDATNEGIQTIETKFTRPL